jgi:ribulose-bisphosphate carboxylase large chain
MKNAFVNLKYKPTSNDLICLFKVTPNKMSLVDAANTVALESSVGTWTPVSSNKAYVNKLGAKVFSINHKTGRCKIAYPEELFEDNNMPDLLSSIAGNVFGMKAIKGLRLEDVDFPVKYMKTYPGPRYGIKGIRKLLKVKYRPLVGTIVKPKLGLKTKDHAQTAYEAWLGGCDIVKDDENLSSQKFNPFEKRAAKTLEFKDKAEQETGEKKAYLINVTAEAFEMVRRADLVKELGGNYVMHDILTAGFSSLQTLRQNTKLPIHAHRAMHGALTENPVHGISMLAIADFARLCGVDTLHIGTGIGKMKGGWKEVEEIREEIELQRIKKTANRLKENWNKIKSVMAVCSGGIYPGHIPFLMKHYGNDIVVQAGGGVHGHPKGTVCGAKAMRQAVDLTLQHKPLNKETVKQTPELEEAMNYFGYNVRF